MVQHKLLGKVEGLPELLDDRGGACPVGASFGQATRGVISHLDFLGGSAEKQPCRTLGITLALARPLWYHPHPCCCC